MKEGPSKKQMARHIEDQVMYGRSVIKIIPRPSLLRRVRCWFKKENPHCENINPLYQPKKEIVK